LRLSENPARPTEPTEPGYNRPERGNDPWAPQQQNRPRGDIEPYRNGHIEAYQGDIEPYRERGQPARLPGTEIGPWQGRARKPVPAPRFPLLYRIVFLILIVVIAILAAQFYQARSQPGTGTASPSPTTRSLAPTASSPASSASAGPTRPSTASPTQPTPSSQADTGGPAGAVTTVHSGAPLTIPPLASYNAASIDLMDPTVSTGSLPEEDMTLGGDYIWNTNYPIASLGTAAPSYAACENVLKVSPMNLSTQTFQQGDGYCLQLPDVNQEHVIAYIKFTMLAPYQPDASTGTSEIKMQVTLWESAASG